MHETFVRFPQEESGQQRKLSRPWHGLYWIIARDKPDLTVQKVYYLEDNPILVHQFRIIRCPLEVPAGYYQYGSKHRGPGRPLKWVNDLLTAGNDTHQDTTPSQTDTPESEPVAQ